MNSCASDVPTECSEHAFALSIKAHPNCIQGALSVRIDCLELAVLQLCDACPMSQKIARLVVRQRGKGVRPTEGKIKAAMCAAVGWVGGVGRSATWREVHVKTVGFVHRLSRGNAGTSAHRASKHNDA